MQKEADGSAKEQELDLVAICEADFTNFTYAVQAMIRYSVSVFEYMCKGATMTKCRPKDQYRRRFYLSEDHTAIRWEPCKENVAGISLSTVKFIRIGQSTAAFRKARGVSQYARLSFSLVYGECFETLDLIAHRAEDFDRWVEGLQSLVAGAADRCVPPTSPQELMPY